MAKKNIAIVGVPTTFVKKVSQIFAETTDMFYADTDELFRYEIKDLKDPETESDKNYILSLESKKIKNVSSFENTVINVSFSALMNNKNYNYLKENSLIIYLYIDFDDYKKLLLSEELSESRKVIEKSTYIDKVVFFDSINDIKIDTKNFDEKILAIKIIEIITEYYS